MTKLLIIIESFCFLMAFVLVTFITPVYTKKARKKYWILRKADGNKHIYVMIIIIFSLVGTGLDCYRRFPKSVNTLHFSFPDFFDFKDHRKEKEFSMTPNALQKDLNTSARCPCGSGKKYSECHHPDLIKDDRNLWRGPKFPQTIYLGYKEKVNGLEFKKKEKAEIILLKENTKIPLCRYFSMNNSILKNKAIIRKLSVEQEDNEFIFSGSLEIESESSEEIQILIGTSNIESVNSFEATYNSVENGSWFASIG